MLTWAAGGDLRGALRARGGGGTSSTWRTPSLSVHVCNGARAAAGSARSAEARSARTIFRMDDNPSPSRGANLHAPAFCEVPDMRHQADYLVLGSAVAGLAFA